MVQSKAKSAMQCPTEKADRRDQAEQEHSAAAALADKHDMVLLQHNPSHYQLRRPGRKWVLNIYPGNQRLFRDRGTPGAPHIAFPAGTTWTLIDVVQGMVDAIEKLDRKGK